MNLRQLEHLLAIAETGSFSRAADRSFITQSALSRSIQSLEVELGAPLLDRIGKRNELTSLGQDIVARSRDILRAVDDVRRKAELLRQGEGGTIRVGLGSGPGALLMTPLLCHVATDHAGVGVDISRGSTELQLLQLRARELDALVIDARRVAPAADLQIEVLTEMRTAFVCRSDHPLALRRAVTFDDILAYPVATTPLSREVARLLVAQYGPQADPARMATLRCEDITSLIDTVARTRAVYLGIVAAARQGIESGQLAELPIDPPVRAVARFACVTLADRTQAPVMSLFRQFVLERLTDVPQQHARVTRARRAPRTVAGRAADTPARGH